MERSTELMTIPIIEKLYRPLLCSSFLLSWRIGGFCHRVSCCNVCGVFPRVLQVATFYFMVSYFSSMSYHNVLYRKTWSVLCRFVAHLPLAPLKLLWRSITSTYITDTSCNGEDEQLPPHVWVRLSFFPLIGAI